MSECVCVCVCPWVMRGTSSPAVCPCACRGSCKRAGRCLLNSFMLCFAVDNGGNSNTHTHTHTIAYTHICMYIKYGQTGGLNFASIPIAKLWRRRLLLMLMLMLVYPTYAFVYPFSFSISLCFCFCLLNSIVARNSSFLCALCVCLRHPAPRKVVWRLWRMQINVGSGNSVLGIMQIFSQYFLLFVVGFSFRFLNNPTTTTATRKNCCCYIGNILLSFNSSSNSRLNF